MQLILDTKASIDLKDKMTTLEEPSDKSGGDVIETLKTEINNGNKENIQSQKNVIRNSVEETNGIENDDNDVNSLKPMKDKTGTENGDSQLANGIQENCVSIATNGYVVDKQDEQELDITTENKDKTLDKKVDDALLDSNLKEGTKTSNIEKDISIDNLKENSTGVVKDKENIEKKPECTETVSEIASETSMDIDNGTENVEMCKKNNDDCTETSFEIRKSSSSIEETVDVHNKSGCCEMDVDVSMSNITSDSENTDEKSSKSNYVVPNNDQSILTIDQEDEVKNSASHSSKLIIEQSLTTVSDTDLQNTVMEDKSISEDSTSVSETAVAETTSFAKNVELDNKLSLDEDIKQDLAFSDNTILNDKTKDDSEILDISASIDQEPSSEKKSNDEGQVLETDSSTIEEKTDKNLYLGTMPSICKELVENNSSTDIVKNTKNDKNTGVESNQMNKETVTPLLNVEVKKKTFSKLVNTLDILSDDEEDAPSKAKETENSSEKQTINIEDDDDIMLIDDDISSKDKPDEPSPQTTDKLLEQKKDDRTIDLENNTENVEAKPLKSNTTEVQKDVLLFDNEVLKTDTVTKDEDKLKEEIIKKPVIDKPLLPENFLKCHKKSLADMTRDDLEEFCILKIVESIVDRSNLCDIKSKLKEMAQNIEEYKKKTMMLTKQNRDLQVVLKSVQEEQKKNAGNPSVITPLKITRSVGMQVLMTEKPGIRKKLLTTTPTTTNNNVRNVRPPNPKSQKATPSVNQTIPVPRLVLASSPVAKTPAPAGQSAQIIQQTKTPSSPIPNGLRNSPPVQKIAEKRPMSRVQSVTVDLTDDEPPSKITPRSSPAPPIRLVASQNLLAPRPQFGSTVNSPRKVYIPISGPQSQNIRPGPALMLKTVQASGPRPRAAPPNVTRMPQNVHHVRMQSRPQNRHPAPLPDAVKQYQPPNWKALPPAPDLKLSKVENGIVISWKIEGYQEDSYEEIASYQLYAYQETSSPPSTALWKKIGDVKALPLPMACTLTHVMAGFKYYFAVRAVDIRSRLGNFSLPGSILLLNKL